MLSAIVPESELEPDRSNVSVKDSVPVTSVPDCSSVRVRVVVSPVPSSFWMTVPSSVAIQTPETSTFSVPKWSSSSRPTATRLRRRKMRIVTWLKPHSFFRKFRGIHHGRWVQVGVKDLDCYVVASLPPDARVLSALRSAPSANAHAVQHRSCGLPDEPIDVIGALDLSLDDQRRQPVHRAPGHVGLRSGILPFDGTA